MEQLLYWQGENRSSLRHACSSNTLYTTDWRRPAGRNPRPKQPEQTSAFPTAHLRQNTAALKCLLTLYQYVRYPQLLERCASTHSPIASFLRFSPPKPSMFLSLSLPPLHILFRQADFNLIHQYQCYTLFNANKGGYCWLSSCNNFWHFLCLRCPTQRTDTLWYQMSDTFRYKITKFSLFSHWNFITVPTFTRV